MDIHALPFFPVAPSLGGQYANSTGCPVLRRLAMWMVSLVSRILVTTLAFPECGLDERTSTTTTSSIQSTSTVLTIR